MAAGYTLLGQDRPPTQSYFRRIGRILLITAFSSGLLALFAFSIISTDWSSGIVQDKTPAIAQKQNVESQEQDIALAATTANVIPPETIPHDVFTMEQDTQPPLPSELASARQEERYLSYLPHSGLHNQRIALINALTLGHMLNRTVVVPYVRLGEPLPWKLRDELETVLEHGENDRRVPAIV